MSCDTLRRNNASTALSRWLGSFVGLAREMPMWEPPRKWIRLTSPMSSGVTWSMSPCMIHSNPSRTPSTSTASNRARIVAAPITLLIPGAGPPPTRIASVLRSVIAVSLPSRGPGAPLAPCEDQDRRYRDADPPRGGRAEAPRPLARREPIGLALERRERRLHDGLPARLLIRGAGHGQLHRLRAERHLRDQDEHGLARLRGLRLEAADVEALPFEAHDPRVRGHVLLPHRFPRQDAVHARDQDHQRAVWRCRCCLGPPVHHVLLRARLGERREALRQGEGVAELGVADL